MRLASIHIYPLKAARAVDLEESCVEPWGLAGDRRWLLVDEDGRFISQREEPSLARVVVSCGPCGIRVSADGRTGLAIAPPPAAAALLKVTVWGSALLVVVPALTGNLGSSVGLSSDVSNNLPLAIYGAVLVFAVLVFPGGIQGGVMRLASAGQALRTALRARSDHDPSGGMP